VRYPVLPRRGETLRIAVPIPERVPDGFVYVPPGRFLYGSANDETRSHFPASPLHEVSTGAYFIGRTEVTFAQWIEFLDSLPPGERARRRPRLGRDRGSFDRLDLSHRSGRWQLAIQPTVERHRAGAGDLVRFAGRAHHQAQDWTRFPVSSITLDDARAYLAWLDRTRRAPGARLCGEHEWERAARGADDREFPSGNRLRPEDANFDETYGRRTESFGPDEVGSHPASDSPFGVADLAGNVWEMVRPIVDAGTPLYASGSWYENRLTCHAMNRQAGEEALRDLVVGLRVCADVP
jgi:formylglycine-generating enzyme required for sulfatase activity